MKLPFIINIYKNKKFAYKAKVILEDSQTISIDGPKEFCAYGHYNKEFGRNLFSCARISKVSLAYLNMVAPPNISNEEFVRDHLNTNNWLTQQGYSFKISDEQYNEISL